MRVQVDTTALIDQTGGWVAGTRVNGNWLDIGEWVPAGMQITIALNGATTAQIDVDVRPYGETSKAFAVRPLNAVGNFVGQINADGDYYIPLVLPGGVPIIAHQIRIGVTFDTTTGSSTQAKARLVKYQPNS